MFHFTGGTAYIDNKFQTGIDVITKGKRIDKVGKNLSTPKSALKVNLSRGQFIVPGMVDAHTHMGVYEDGVGAIGHHYNEMQEPNTAYVRAMDAIFPKDIAFEDARENGVVACGSFPGSANLFGGMCAVVKTYGDTLDDILIAGYHGMKMAIGENPFRVYSNQNMSPRTRLANAGIIRKTLVEVQNYIEKRNTATKNKSKDKDDGVFETDLGKEHLRMLLERKIPARFHCHRRDDIETALRLSQEFNFNLVLEHCTEGYLVADMIAKRNVTCVIGPMATARVKYELKNRSETAPYVLSKAGVNVCLMTDHPVMPIHHLRHNAAMAVRGGCTDDQAMEMITSRPAKLLNIDKNYGSIAKGKLACLAIFSGHPLDMRSKVDHVWIEGEEYLG
ncbi:MAG TPA: amidohydrolase [bacterium]|jgi:imidazolonepropionase-like amidohydrolase